MEKGGFIFPGKLGEYQEVDVGWWECSRQTQQRQEDQAV